MFFSVSRLTINKVCFLVLLVSLLFDGITAEIILVLSASIIFLLNRHNNRKIVGNYIFKKSLLFIVLFFCLFFTHFFYINNPATAFIRLYGLTKSICAPALVFFVFSYVFSKKYSFFSIIMLMIVFNLIYGISGIGTNTDLVVFQLGSYNGCSGIAVIMFPIILYYLRNNKHKKGYEYLLIFLFLISTLWVIYMSESTTTQVIFFAQLTVLFVFSKCFLSFLKKSGTFISILIVLSLLLLSFFIANKTIDLDPSGLKTRVGIWTKAFESYVSLDSINIILGNGDCMVQMQSKILQAHNVFLEILLIYGVTGILFFVLEWFAFIKMFYAIIEKSKLIYLLLSLTSYFLVCFLHPFYTGVFIFQIICIGNICFLLFDKEKKILL